MKDCSKKSLFFPTLFVTVTVMIMTTSLIQINISYGEAVPLIPIHTGNVTLDNGLPVFYDCIDKKIDKSKDDGASGYFDNEPTKYEVTTCYNEVFFEKSYDHSSNDNSDVHSSEGSED